jgi:hypothetical protein
VFRAANKISDVYIGRCYESYQELAMPRFIPYVILNVIGFLPSTSSLRCVLAINCLVEGRIEPANHGFGDQCNPGLFLGQ